MILHIVDEEKFLKGIIEVFEEIYPGQNRYLIGYRSTNEKALIIRKYGAEFLILGKKFSRDYKQQFKSISAQSDLILFHNLYKEYKLSLHNSLPNDKKIAWYFWGAELYGLNTRIENLLPHTRKVFRASLSLKQKIRKEWLGKLKKRYYWNIFKKFVSKDIDYILTNIYEDVELLDNYLSHEAKLLWFTYYTYRDIASYNIKEATPNKKHILVGNSSSETNNHFDTFQLLHRFDLTGKKVYVPLNYGDVKYQKLVLSHLNTELGNLAVPLIDYLSLPDYLDIIKSCSVVIMNHKRQQAFNTIMLALSVGCKVFLREENTIYGCLKREGFILYSINKDLENNTAFCALSEEQQSHNIELVRKLYSYEEVKNKIQNSITTILSE